jgi:hypothetical protein
MTKALVVFCLMSTVTLWGQRITDRRTAQFRGGGDEGKCTIELVVDQLAEVEIRGRSASVRTLRGSPSSFRRFECNRELPSRPFQFRFAGVDGRGRQSLVRSPERGGAAVIRIEDSRGGSEGYTFDIFWREGGGRRR